MFGISHRGSISFRICRWRRTSFPWPFLSATLILSVLLGCFSDEDNPVAPTAFESAVLRVSSFSSGKAKTSSGYGIEVLAGVVPVRPDGSAAEIVFSIEHPVELPGDLPGDAELAGEVVQFGPESGAFRWPLRILLPYPDEAGPDEFQALHYDRMIEQWRAVPVSYLDRRRRVLGVDVLELGIYAVAKMSAQQGEAKPGLAPGGIEVKGKPGYHYALTVESAHPRDFYRPDVCRLDGQVAGCSMADTGTAFHARLPQGDYSIRLSRMKAYGVSGLPAIETCLAPVQFRIARPVTDWGLASEKGWAVLDVSQCSGWRDAVPSSWPMPRTLLGTGDLQVTLTWMNTDREVADLDLHLYGPGNLHLYWDRLVSPDSALRFETDWMKEPGKAVENIYAAGPVKKGTYRVEVQHYSGSRMSFRVRVVFSNQVKTSFGMLREKEVRQVVKFEVQ